MENPEKIDIGLCKVTKMITSIDELIAGKDLEQI